MAEQGGHAGTQALPSTTAALTDSNAISPSQEEQKVNGSENPQVQFNGLDSSPKSEDPKLSQMLSERGREQTSLHHREKSYVPHRYVVRRPRALQVEYHGNIIEVGDSGKIELDKLESMASNEATRTTSESTDENNEERSTDDVHKQRERIDLFVDLIWVGIISNLSEHFFTESFSPHSTPGRAIQVFIVLFIPAWQMWAQLQLFLNTYYMDDALQRYLLLWILTLGVAWGNVAPYGVPEGEDQNYHSGVLISLYLIALASLSLTEFIYSFWVTWSRRIFLLRFIIILPGVALWIAAIETNGDTRLAFMWAAVSYERGYTIFADSPFVDRFLGDKVKKAYDRNHIRKRFESFFIIALGEGVFLLIRGSPLGTDINEHLGRGIIALSLYFCLHTVYFNGDLTKTSVHPVHRRWYIRALWLFAHVVIFGSLILLSSAILYLVTYEYVPPEGAGHGSAGEHAAAAIGVRSEGGGGEVSTSIVTLLTALVTAYAALATVLLCFFITGLLAKPLDPPGTLFVSNRYVRMAPRLLAVVVLATVWRAQWDAPDPTAAIGYMTVTMWAVMGWEWLAGMEKGFGFFEPKPV